MGKVSGTVMNKARNEANRAEGCLPESSDGVVSFQWMCFKANFMRNLSWIHFFNERASWGEIGKQNMVGYQFLMLITFFLFGAYLLVLDAV